MGCRYKKKESESEIFRFCKFFVWYNKLGHGIRRTEGNSDHQTTDMVLMQSRM